MASPLYLPHFLQSELQSGDTIEEINLHLQEKDWLTIGLVDEEITSFFPKHDDVNSQTGECEKDKFAEPALDCYILSKSLQATSNLTR